LLSQMSDLKIRIIDSRCRLQGSVSQDDSCVYCGSPTVAYVWCKRHMMEMVLIKRAIQNAQYIPIMHVEKPEDEEDEEEVMTCSCMPGMYPSASCINESHRGLAAENAAREEEN